MELNTELMVKNSNKIEARFLERDLYEVIQEDITNEKKGLYRCSLCNDYYPLECLQDNRLDFYGKLCPNCSGSLRKKKN